MEADFARDTDRPKSRDGSSWQRKRFGVKAIMETTIMGYIGIIGYILGLYWDNGKENGNYRIAKQKKAATMMLILKRILLVSLCPS